MVRDLKSKDTKPNYSADIQKLYIQLLLSDPETFIRCQNIFDPENFDRSLRSSAEYIKKYVDEYGVIPEPVMIKAVTGTEFELVPESSEHSEWLMDEFERFNRHKALERAILKSSDLLEDGQYGPVEKLIKSALEISLNRDLGTDFWHDPKKVLESIKAGNGQISSGWPSLDQKLYGGFNRGELNIFCAGSGGGKSLFLANLAMNLARAGLNAVYLTFELSEALVSMRLSAMATGVASKQIFQNLDDVVLKIRTLGKKSGAINIKYMPSGKTVHDIKSYLKEYRIKTGNTPDVVLVDYLDLMMPAAAKISAENLFIKDKYVSEELRDMASSLKLTVLSAAQINRAGVEEVEFGHQHISGGLSKIQTADNVFGIRTSRAMRESGRYELQFMKTRSSSGVGSRIELGFDVDTLQITDLGEQSESLNDQSNSSTTAKIQDLVKRTSNVTTNEKTDPFENTKKFIAPAPRAQVDGARLKELLGTLRKKDSD